MQQLVALHTPEQVIFEGSSSFERTSGTLGIQLTTMNNTSKSTLQHSVSDQVIKGSVKQVRYTFVRYALAQAYSLVHIKRTKYTRKDVIRCMSKLAVKAYRKKHLEDSKKPKFDKMITMNAIQVTDIETQAKEVEPIIAPDVEDSNPFLLKKFTQQLTYANKGGTGHITAMFNLKAKNNDSLEGGSARRPDSSNSFRSEFLETQEDKKSVALKNQGTLSQ